MIFLRSSVDYSLETGHAASAAAATAARHHMDEQIRQAHAAVSGYDVVATSNANVKTSSAFSPIQAGMIQTAQAAAGFPMTAAAAASSRGYSFYDPIGFQKHSQVIKNDYA